MAIVIIAYFFVENIHTHCAYSCGYAQFMVIFVHILIYLHNNYA